LNAQIVVGLKVRFLQFLIKPATPNPYERVQTVGDRGSLHQVIDQERLNPPTEPQLAAFILP
jgi:hypothetical protein